MENIFTILDQFSLHIFQTYFDLHLKYTKLKLTITLIRTIFRNFITSYSMDFKLSSMNDNRNKQLKVLLSMINPVRKTFLWKKIMLFYCTRS